MTSSLTTKWYHHPLPGSGDYEWADAQKCVMIGRGDWWWYHPVDLHKKTGKYSPNSGLQGDDDVTAIVWRLCPKCVCVGVWIWYHHVPMGVIPIPIIIPRITYTLIHTHRPHTVFWQCSCPAAVLKARCKSQMSRPWVSVHLSETLSGPELLHEKLLPNSWRQDAVKAHSSSESTVRGRTGEWCLLPNKYMGNEGRVSF